MPRVPRVPREAWSGGAGLADERLLRRARMHAALGEPVRLAMVGRLWVTDASPGELGAAHGLATNVLAHHVKVLQAAGLVRRVVFVCTANSARSQLAAATWRQVSRLPVASAGTHPAPQVHPRAMATGRRHGLRIDPASTAQLADIAGEGDLVVCVCDNAHEELAAAGLLGPGVVGQVHWAVPDPVPAHTDEAFETAYVQIAGRVERLAHALDAAAS